MKKVFVILSLLLSLPVAMSAAWQAQWIAASDCQNKANTWQVFRKVTNISAVPHQLTARICTDTKYWLWVNGRQVVFEGGLKRGPSPADSYYDEVNIAPYLHQGSNTIALLTWHFGKEGFSHKNSGRAALLFDAEAGGVKIVSNSSWEAAVYGAYEDTDEPKPNFRLAESNVRFDARRAWDGWYQPAYSKHFPAAVIVASQAENSKTGRLVKRPIPLFRDYGLKDYVSQTFDEKTRILSCRLPYNAQVTPWIEVEAEAGKVIGMQTDDYVIGSERSVRAEYVTRDGRQSYESLGWMNGNNVEYSIPEGVKVVAVKYRETGYDTQIVGAFTCDDLFLNELWKRSARTLYLNMRDTYFDCPDRERAQWWGDIVDDISENFYTLSPSASALVVKGIRELINWQRKDQVIFAPIPAGNWDKELPCQMLMAVGWYGFQTQAYYSGDASFVPDVYDGVHRYLHQVWKTDSLGLAITRQGNWSWADWGDNIDLDVLTNVWYYLALKGEKTYAAQLKKTADVAMISRMMKRMEQNFDHRFWTGSAYRSPSYKGQTDDRAQAMAVVSGLASRDKYPALIKILKENYFAGPLLELYVQEALYRMGEPVFALQRAKKRFSQMMAFKDQTTVFENWDRSGSINHAWSSIMTVVLGKYVCGIQPTSPGFKTFRVAPQLSGLTQASAQMQTKYGFIRVNLQQTAKGLRVKLSVPASTSATIEAGGKTVKVGAGEHTLTL